MLHFLNFSNNGLVGTSTITHAYQSLNVTNETEIKAEENLSNSLSGILISDGVMSDQQKKAARDAWEQSVKKGGVGVVSGGLRF
jgi:hypothetical protein